MNALPTVLDEEDDDICFDLPELAENEAERASTSFLNRLIESRLEGQRSITWEI